MPSKGKQQDYIDDDLSYLGADVDLGRGIDTAANAAGSYEGSLEDRDQDCPTTPIDFCPPITGTTHEGQLEADGHKPEHEVGGFLRRPRYRSDVERH